MLTLDLFHIALTAKPRYRDKPDRYKEAMIEYKQHSMDPHTE